MTSEASARKVDTVVLVHGLYLTGLSWEGWPERYAARGYKVLAPSWPGLEGTVEDLRRDTAPIAALEIPAIVDHYDRIIKSLDKPPFIMGHSFGGAITQLLANRGLGAAAVPIDSAQVRGVLRLPFSTLKANFALLRNPIARKKAIMLSEKEFHYGFTNTLTAAEAKPYYDRYAVPGARNLLFTGAYANLNPGSALKVDFKNPRRPPMLFISGGKDHVVPAAVNHDNFEKYKTPSLTDYKVFPGRPHFTCVVPGWEEVADYAIDWCERVTAI